MIPAAPQKPCSELPERRPRVARDEQRHRQRRDQQQRPEPPRRAARVRSTNQAPATPITPRDRGRDERDGTVLSSSVARRGGASASLTAEKPPWNAWTIVTPTGKTTAAATKKREAARACAGRRRGCDMGRALIVRLPATAWVTGLP